MSEYTPTHSDLLWFVGLWEGEGFITTSAKATGASISFGIQMTDLDIIQRAQRIMGGNITIVKPGKNKQCFIIRKYFQPIDGTPVMNLIHRMWPLLGYRRQEQVINIIERQRQIKKDMGVQDRQRPTKAHKGHT